MAKRKRLRKRWAGSRRLKRRLNKFHISSVDAEKQFQDNVAKIKASTLERLQKDIEAREAEKASIERGFEELTALQIERKKNGKTH